jgi:thiamine pyrophosphokinase
MVVITIGALGGRFDQSMDAINILYKYKHTRTIYLMSEESVAFLLDEAS